MGVWDDLGTQPKTYSIAVTGIAYALCGMKVEWIEYIQCATAGPNNNECWEGCETGSSNVLIYLGEALASNCRTYPCVQNRNSNMQRVLLTLMSHWKLLREYKSGPLN